MHDCPHCQRRQLPTFGVRWSSREHPVKCAACGKLAHVIASTGNGIPSASLMLLVLTALVAVILGSWLTALAGLTITVAYNVWAWSRVELFPITEEASREAGNQTLIVVLIAALLRIFSS